MKGSIIAKVLGSDFRTDSNSFLRKVLSKAAKKTSSKYFNLGGDELAILNTIRCWI